MNILFDYNLSPRLARALQELFRGEHVIVALRDKFDPAVDDTDWIRRLSEQGNWIVVSSDRRITKNKAEREIFRNSRLIGLFFAPGLYKAPVTKQAERILALWSAMEKLVSVVQGGAMFELPMRSQRIKQLKT